MSDADKSMKVGVDFVTTGQDAVKQGADELKRVKQNTDEFSTSMPAAWQGLEKYKQALKASGMEAEALETHVHGLTQLMRGGGPVAAELGHLLHFAFNPAMLGAAAAAGGLEIYFHWLEKIQEKHREMIVDMARLNDFQHQLVKDAGDYYEMMFKTSKVIADVRAAQAGLAADLKEMEETSKRFEIEHADDMANRIESRRTENSIIEDQITLLEQIGKLTPTEAKEDKLRVQHDEKLAEIQDKVNQAKHDYESAKTDEDRELKTAGGRGAFSPEAIGAAQDAADRARNKVKQDEDLIGEAGKKQLSDIDKIIEDNKTKMKQDTLHWNDYVTANLELEERKRRVLGQINAAQGSYESDQTAAAAADQHLKDLQALHDKFATLDADLATLHQKMTDAAAAAPGKAAQENQKFALEFVNASGKTPGEIFNDAVQAMFTLNHLKEQTGFNPVQFAAQGPQQSAIIQHLQSQAALLGTLETALGNNGTNVLAAINSLIKTAGSNMDALQETVRYAQGLEMAINQIRAQVGSMGRQQY